MTSNPHFSQGGRFCELRRGRERPSEDLVSDSSTDAFRRSFEGHFAGSAAAFCACFGGRGADFSGRAQTTSAAPPQEGGEIGSSSRCGGRGASVYAELLIGVLGLHAVSWSYTRLKSSFQGYASEKAIQILRTVTRTTAPIFNSRRRIVSA